MTFELKPIIEFDRGTLTIRHASEAWISERLGNQSDELAWLVRDPRDDVYRCDAMRAASLARCLKADDQPSPDVVWVLQNPNLNFPNERHLFIGDKRKISLREDQKQAVESFCLGGHQGLIVMPTGTGKTVVAIELMIRLQCSTLIVVPVRDLMYQWHEKILQSTGIDAGLIGDGVHRVSPISVTTYDSAAIHMPRIGDKFSMVIFDEVHHLAGPWRSDAARMSAASRRLGLTATLPREPARLASLYDLVGPVLYQQNIADAAGDTLAQYSVRRIAVRMNEQERTAYSQYSRTIQQFVSDRRQLDPQFIWEDVYKLVADAEGDPKSAASAMLAVAAFRSKRKIEEQAAAKMRILEDLFRLHAGSPVIVFTGSNVMARQISTRFLVPCLLSNCAKKERQDLLRGFAEGRYPALVANRVLDEGVDLPEVKTAIVMGGLSSQRQAIQRLGRVLRKGTNNETAVLYEVVTEDSGEVQRSRDRRRNEAYRARPKS
jgi:superfamily II DNA or RNA helicase